MSLEDLGIIGYEHVSRTLLIDGDILIFRLCCVFNDDDDISRKLITQTADKQITELMRAADCDKYILFLTTKSNFRDDLVDDYKANRKDLERPVNLTWAKRWALDSLNTKCEKKLEADDLLGIYMKDNCVIWSLDKDLRQVPGEHLDDATQKLIVVSELGQLIDRGKKIYFDGLAGFYYQLLTGDSTDHILGCGKRIQTVYKSGAKKGETYIKRQGVGPKAAFKIITAAAISDENNPDSAMLEAVKQEYIKVHGDDWQSNMETQAQLLYMIREQDGDTVKMWTYDNRDKYFNLVEGVFLNDGKV